jgi:hypothetical protein
MKTEIVETDNGKQKVTILDSGTVIREPYSEAVKQVVYVNIATDQDSSGVTPGIVNDGVDSIGITVILKDSEGNTLPVTDSYRIALRDRTGAEYSVVKVKFSDGVSYFNYKTTNRAATISISLDDLEIPGMDVDFQIVGSNKFFICEDFSQLSVSS